MDRSPGMYDDWATHCARCKAVPMPAEWETASRRALLSVLVPTGRLRAGSLGRGAGGRVSTPGVFLAPGSGAVAGVAPGGRTRKPAPGGSAFDGRVLGARPDCTRTRTPARRASTPSHAPVESTTQSLRTSPSLRTPLARWVIVTALPSSRRAVTAVPSQIVPP